MVFRPVILNWGQICLWGGDFWQGSPTPRASVRIWASEQKLSSGPLNEVSPAVPLHSPSLALLLNQPLCSHTQSMEKIVFHETGPWSKNVGDHWFGIIQRQFWLLQWLGNTIGKYGLGSGILLRILQDTGQPPQQRIIWPQMAKVPRLRSPALETSLSRPISSGHSDGLSYKAQCLELDMWYLPG